jgi:hypothetical protein
MEPSLDGTRQHYYYRQADTKNKNKIKIPFFLFLNKILSFL